MQESFDQVKASVQGSMFSTEGRESYSVERAFPSQPPSHQWMEDALFFKKRNLESVMIAMMQISTLTRRVFRGGGEESHIACLASKIIFVLKLSSSNSS